MAQFVERSGYTQDQKPLVLNSQVNEIAACLIEV